MSTFKQFGGIQFNAKNNYTNSLSAVNNFLQVTDAIGDTNTRIVNHSHIDLSGNSIIRVDGIYFMDGSIQKTASTGSTGSTGSVTPTPTFGSTGTVQMGPMGPQGPPGPVGPAGQDGVDGSNVGVLSDEVYNTFIGTDALVIRSPAAKYNTAAGSRAIYKNTVGYANSALGYESLVNNTMGSFNTAIGSQALAFNIAGTRCTALGAGADVAHPALQNATAIGAGARANTSNVIQLGNTSVQHVITSGVITGSAKNFSIPHPLPRLAETHTLKHVSVESPRLDLIYRDSLHLDKGKAVVDLDIHFGMTPGTFSHLCKNPSTFVSNQSDWDPVKAYTHIDEETSTATLTIMCKNTTSEAEVAFLVVAERKDPTILQSSITDTSGSFIPESENIATYP